MKSNPYIYTYTPFENLSNKNFRHVISSKSKINKSELIKLVSEIPTPKPKVTGKTVAERVFSIFKDDNIRFGAIDFLVDDHDSWISKLEYFINRKKPIQFSFLGFPFKIPVPLKTNRELPDFSEVLILTRLKQITDLIKKEYKFGVNIAIFAEGGLSRFVGVNKKIALNYREFLSELNKMLKYSSSIIIRDLAEMEKSIPNFWSLWKAETKIFEDKYKNKDQKYMPKYLGTYEPMYRAVKPTNIQENLLMDIYNGKLSDENLAPRVRQVRKKLKHDAHKAVISYHAYFQVRDNVNYINSVLPNVLQLTVSPKINRLGIITVNAENKRLPYHGVPVFYPKKNLFLIEYLIDLKRSAHKYEEIYFMGDKENKPFFYKVV